MDLVVYNIVKDWTILLEHIICTHSESCFGDLIKQSGYLVRFISIKHFMPPCSPFLRTVWFRRKKVDFFKNSYGFHSAVSVTRIVGRRSPMAESHFITLLGMREHAQPVDHGVTNRDVCCHSSLDDSYGGNSYSVGRRRCLQIFFFTAACHVVEQVLITTCWSLVGRCKLNPILFQLHGNRIWSRRIGCAPKRVLILGTRSL